MTYDVRATRAAHLRAAVLAVTVSVALSTTMVSCGPDDPEAAPAGTDPSPTSSGSAPAGSSSAAPTPSPGAPTSAATPVSRDLDADQFAALVDAAIDDTMGVRLSVDNGLGLLGGEGVADFREDPTALGMTLTSTETGDDQAIDVKVGAGVLFIESGRRWLRVDIDSAANPFGRSLTDQLDPRRVLDEVVDSFASATRRGTARRGGELLTSYRATADGPAVAQALAPELAGQEGVVVPAVVSCTLLVAPDGLARSITVDLGEENGQIVYTLSGWGDSSDLTVAPPPVTLVDDLGDLDGQP